MHTLIIRKKRPWKQLCAYTVLSAHWLFLAGIFSLSLSSAFNLYSDSTHVFLLLMNHPIPGFETFLYWIFCTAAVFLMLAFVSVARDLTRGDTNET